MNFATIWRKRVILLIMTLAFLTTFSMIVVAQTPQTPVFFRQSPLLVRSATTYRNPSVLANYQFTIEIPPMAGSSLLTVKLIQQPNLETLQLYPEQTQVFIGDHRAKRIIPIEDITFDNHPDNSVSLTLAQAVQPGNVFTVSLRGRNPQYGGIYQFGITVFPEGNFSQGLYLGVGRLHFSMPGGLGS